MSERAGWIGVDFDHTLAYYEKGMYPSLGPPIQRMVERVQQWLKEGKTVKIFTARVSNTRNSLDRHIDAENQRLAIQLWCETHIGQRLEVTNVKDYDMDELWDDKAHGVEKNTGRTLYEVGFEDGSNEGFDRGYRHAENEAFAPRQSI